MFHTFGALCVFIEPIAYAGRYNLRRLYSTFAEGLPGVGLLLMRLVSGIGLIANGFIRLHTGLPIQAAILEMFTVAAGLLLFAGLWTPIAGSLVAVVGIWNCISHDGDPWANIFLATIGAALALLGPGAWSVDARLFGWKRIEVRDRKD